VVYKINCHDCNASYVGQTKRQLATRVRERKADINKESGTSSVITNHRLELNVMQWNEVLIMDSEFLYKKKNLYQNLYKETTTIFK